MMKAYKAYAKGDSVVADTPRKAAVQFFAKHPNRRKCNVITGEDEGFFFVVKFTVGKRSTWPTAWSDVTAKTVADLPDTNEPPEAAAAA